MKTLMLPALAAALVFAAPSSSLAASRDVSIRAITLAGDFPGAEIFAHTPDSKDPGTKVTVKTFLNHESDPVTPASGKVIFTSQAAAASVEDKAAVLAELKVPSGLKSGILVFLPDSKGKADLVSLIDDGTSAFPLGSTLVLNSTKAELRLEIEGKNFEVKAGGTLVIRDQPVGPSHASAVKAFTKTDGEWAQISSTIWPQPGTKRVLQIATENPQSKMIELHGVRDISSPR